MNKYIVFALLGMFVCAFGAPTLRSSMDDPRTVLAQIDSTPFGNSILSMVAVHLATNSPLDEIISLLGQIRSQLATDQEKDDETNRTDQANCDTLIQQYNDQIVKFTQERNENIKIRDLNIAALKIAKKDLKQTIASLNTNAKRLSEGQSERDQQHDIYAASMSDHENGVKALDGAIQLLQHLQAGTSFIQLKKRFDTVMSELVEVSQKSKSSHLFAPLISALAQLAEKASPETIKKILDLFNQLRAQFVKDQQTLTNIENNQMAAWISLKADLETEKEQLNDKRADLERQIEGYRKIIADCKKNIQYETEQLELANTNLQATIASCNKLSAAYTARQRERSREDDIIGRVVDYFQKRAQGATAFVQDRVAAASL